MDMNFHGAGMPRLVGGAGFSGGTTGPGSNIQFRVLPSPLPSECLPSELDAVAVHSQIQPLKLRCGSAVHRPLASAEPLQSGPHSPSQEKEYSLLKSNSLLLRNNSPEEKKATTLRMQSMPLKLDYEDATPELDGVEVLPTMAMQ